MASNAVRWMRNLQGAKKPLIVRGLFQAGASQAIKAGEILELTNDSSTRWIPINSDFAMAGDIAIANEEIKSGDRAGYYEIIVPRPGDVFEYDLAAADTVPMGTALYFSDSETVTVSAGTNEIGYAVGQDSYPDYQGHLSDDASGDSGETLKDVAQVQMAFARDASYYAILNVA